MEKMQEHWIQKIQTIVDEAKHIPLFGNVPAFNFEEYAKEVAKALSIPALTLSASAPSFIDFSGLTPWLKDPSTFHVLTFSSLEGQMVWIMSSQDRDSLTSNLLSASHTKGFTDPKFKKGFYQYILLEALHCFDTSKIYPDLHPQLSQNEIQSDEFSVMDISIQWQESTINAKCALSKTLLSSLKGHYQSKPIATSTLSSVETIDVLLKLQVARTSLTLKQWQKVNVGDCILLDQCSFDPETLKGSVTIVLEETPIFRARVKKNSLKIQDYAFYYEEQQAMSEQPISPDDANLEESFSDTEDALSDEESHLWSQEAQSSGSLEPLISSHEIPLTLVVEVDRIRMNLEKLLKLSPGNVLELATRPEQGVSVTVGGKKIAHAELVKLGETLGIKILKLADRGA